MAKPGDDRLRGKMLVGKGDYPAALTTAVLNLEARQRVDLLP